MENSNWVKYKIEVREKLKKIALNIIFLSEKISSTTSGKVLNYQITKSGTRAYANYRAALRGRSKAEFFSKLSISVEQKATEKMGIVKDQKEFMKDLKPVYQAVSKGIAEQQLEILAEKWGKKYPVVIDSWKRNRDKLSTYF